MDMRYIYGSSIYKNYTRLEHHSIRFVWPFLLGYGPAGLFFYSGFVERLGLRALSKTQTPCTIQIIAPLLRVYHNPSRVCYPVQ